MKLIDFFGFLRDKSDFVPLNVLTRNGLKVPVAFMDEAYKMEVIKFDRTGETGDVYINAGIDDLSPEGTKFYWKVWQSAEGCTDGYVLLTKKEAEIVSYVTDQDNWKHLSDEPYSGCFSIDLDNPIPVDEFERSSIVMTYKNFFNFLRNDYDGVVSIFTKNGISIPSNFVDELCDKEVVKFEQVSGFYRVYLDVSLADIADDDTKFYWKVRQTAEDETTGYVKLTKKEAEIVAYATDCDNWKNVNDNPWSGSFIIDLSNPVLVDEFEKGVC